MTSGLKNSYLNNYPYSSKKFPETVFKLYYIIHKYNM